MYTVTDAQIVLRYWGLDFSEPYIRGLLRAGITRGQIQSKKKGWTIAESDLQTFVEARVPAARYFGVASGKTIRIFEKEMETADV